MSTPPRLLWTLLLSLLATAMVALLAWEVLTLGVPSAATVIGAVLTVALAITAPLVARAPISAQPVCRDCRIPAVGFGEFGFCLRCGSTRTVRGPPSHD